MVASKVVSILEKRYVDLATVTPSSRAREISAQTGKPAAIVQLILQESTGHYLATPTGPIIARHTLGYQLTSAGVDRAGPGGAWVPPVNPDASARPLHEALSAATGVDVAVVIADSDGRADRRGATVNSLGAAGTTPLRIIEHTEPAGNTTRQEETLTDMLAATAGHRAGPTRTRSASRRRPRRGLRAQRRGRDLHPLPAAPAVTVITPAATTPLRVFGAGRKTQAGDSHWLVVGVSVVEPAGREPLAVDQLRVSRVAGQCPADEQQFGPLRAQQPRHGAVLAVSAEVHRRGPGDARGGDAGPIPRQHRGVCR